MRNLNQKVRNNEEEYEYEYEFEEDEDEEEEEEALSLCDLPLNRDETEINSTHHHRRSSSQLSEYAFEFSNDLNSDDISHAEDIIHGGKLAPYKQHQNQPPQQPLFDDRILRSLSEDYESANFSRRYCDSLPTRSNSGARTTLPRSSRSFDRKKLRRNSSLVMKSEASDGHRSSSRAAAARPRWYDLMFGSVKLPTEMDLQDMKNRQIRRNFGGGSPAMRSDRRSSWGQDLLKALSCKNDSSSVAVTASVGLVPQI